MTDARPNDLISVSEARKILGVSRFKIAELIKRKLVRSYENPLDRRVKLISRAELLALKPNRAEAA
jgi:DNA-binding MarR family transcriptional regulator